MLRIAVLDRRGALAIVPPMAVLCAFGSAACWGFGIVASKGALEAGVPPLTLISLQLGISLAVLMPAVLVRRAPWPSLPDFRSAGWSGVLEYGATYALAAFGLALTTAGNAAIIGTAEPALVVVAAAVLLRERVGRPILLLLALVTAGLLLVIAPDLTSAGTPGLGDLLVLGSAATGAIYAALCRRLVAGIAPLPLSIIQQLAGLLAVLAGTGAAALAGDSSAGVATLGLAALGLAALSGLLQHAAAVWLHLHALKRMPAGSFAMFLALVPVFALLGAYLALGEEITTAQLAGGTLILAAAIIAGHLTPSTTSPTSKETSDDRA